MLHLSIILIPQIMFQLVVSPAYKEDQIQSNITNTENKLDAAIQIDGE